MPQGYEGYIGYGEQWKGWGTETHLPLRNYLEPESETLDEGIEENMRENKIRGQRTLRLTDVSNDVAKPNGAVVFQPRTDELAPLCAAHFQCWGSDGGVLGAGSWQGTYHFALAPSTPDFVGSSWGSYDVDDNSFIVADFYCLRMFKTMGSVLEQNAHLAFQIPNGYVEQMDWKVENDEADLVVTPTFAFRGTSPSEKMVSKISTVTAQSNSPYLLRFSGWNATMTVDGTANTSLDIENWHMLTVSGGFPRGRLGNYGPQTFPFSNTPHDTGDFTLEFKAAKWVKRNFAGTGTFSMVVRFQTEATHWVEIRQPHCKFKPLTPQISGQDTRIDTNFNYEAYGSGGTPSTIVLLYTKYATSSLSMDLAEGQARAV